MKDLTPPLDRTRSLVTRVLWRIEARLSGTLSLNALADLEQVSPFTLSRAFSLATGQSVMAYVKARRLSEAARSLRDSEMQIVEIALDAGYDSHEGFSRAFREHFGCSPSGARQSSDFSLTLQEAIIMPAQDLPKLSPRFETRGAERLVGRARRYTMETRAKIPQLWEETVAEMGHAMYEPACYGACYDFEGESFTYLVGIADDGRLDTEGLDHLNLPAGEYAVFEHEGHVSSIAETWTAIFEAWAPSADVVPTNGPEFELYAPEFDLEKPGGVSIWIPITPKT